MRRFVLAVGLLLASALCALAQNPVVPTPPTMPCDNSNRVANTAWVTICGGGGGGGGGGITALTGDVTATGPGSAAATLATVNTNVGTWGTATQIPEFTVNGKGLITAATQVPITLSGAYPSITGVGTLTSGATGAGFTLNFGASSLSGLVPLANGGTNASLTPSNGGIFYSTGSSAAILPGTPAPAQCLLSGASSAPSWGSCLGGAAVSSVTSPDGTLTVSPTSGAVGVILNPSASNTWTAVQTFTNSDLRLLGSSTGGTTFTSDNASATNFTMHVPASNSTLVDLVSAQTLTNKTWNGVPITGTFIANNTVANANLAQMGGNTVKCNPTGSTANAVDCTGTQIAGLLGVITVPNGGTGAGTFTANLPLIGNGTAALAQGTRSGNTTAFVTTTGAQTSGNCVSIDANGNHVASGGTCAAGIPMATSAKSLPNVSASTQTTTAATVASSANITLASAIDFRNGQGIRINHAGPTFSASPPTGLTVAPQGTTGGSTYTYTIACLDGSGTTVNGGIGAAITPVSTTTGNASLSRANYNSLSWSGGAGCVGYAVYRSIAGTQTLIAMVVGTTYSDYGSAAISPPDWIPATAGGAALNDWLITTISSGGGTTSLTLGAAASQNTAASAALHSDTAALQTWINSCQNFNCYLDYGTYQIDGPLTITNGTKFYGAGRQLSQINSAAPFDHILVLRLSPSAPPMTVVDVSFTGQQNTNSGASIYVTASSGEAYSPIFDRIATYSGAYGLYFDRISLFRLVSSNIQGQAVAGVYVANLDNPDAGDSVIADNYMSVSYGALADIEYVSSGGLKIHGNKLLSEVTVSYGILFSQTAGTSSADLLITGNSIEGQYLNGIIMVNGTGAVWSNILITGNELAGQLQGITVAGGSGWAQNLTITGNTVQISPTSCITISGIVGYTITGNVCLGTNVANTIGILTDGTASQGSVGGNSVRGYSTSYSFAGPITIETSNVKNSSTSGSQAINLFRLGLATSYTSAAKCDFTVTGAVTSVGGGVAFGGWIATQFSTAGSIPTTAVVTAPVQSPTNASDFVNSISAGANFVDFITTINPPNPGSVINGNIRCTGSAFTLANN